MEGCSISTIISALCGIRWGHINAGFSSPTDHSIVKLAFAGAKRLVGKTCNKKEPFTVDIIKEIIAYYGETLKVKDLEDKQDSFEISVKKSKTDQLREGHIVYIAHTGNSTCPVTWLRKYLCGASAAANNGVTDRMISKHGRWSSSSSRDGYIKDSKSQRLSVSKDLGLKCRREEEQTDIDNCKVTSFTVLFLGKYAQKMQSTFGRGYRESF
ncbi:uncharacterized protein LOC130646057 [Hydractinia symbiolongicarpus]|uniref:uncharacterized protein LOC130646057 n=1 Tax=Hydractinia symbiolongicarpus TaxID=13093 RepID=UPI00254C5843|nr:uncharacterized protein LOC130646057 [Hydractinia symbiolongicarpus]